ncbi:hypothetical protein EZV62_016867 [Acer yangbiense]|uniref:Uncharacterized protein n=1 Tax=Acer yangbiense TaxID=1000413 RepID=A0A5C7HQJ3_9ROSI|nr:hypothetical protein EZV62_016867 [Acer yangbiense]
MAQFLAHHPPPPPPPPPNPVPIIGHQYCAPYPVDLAIVRKVMNITDGNFVVQDINNNGNILFKLKGFLMTLHNRRVLFDAAGIPLVTLRGKIMPFHDRWQVFRGESTDLNDLIFTVKKSSMLQLKAKLDVFLANNTKEDVCDFKVKGSWSKESCVVYAGESDTIVAQMLDNTSTVHSLIGKDRFEVRVYTNIDHAFIITLIMILDAIDPLPPGLGVTTDLVTGIDPSSLT